MANRHMKNCSPLLISRKVQIKWQWDIISQSENGIYQKDSSISKGLLSILRYAQKKEPSFSVGGILSYQASKKKSIYISFKGYNTAFIWPTLWHIPLNKTEKVICILIFIKQVNRIARVWKKLKCVMTYKYLRSLWHIVSLMPWLI